MYTVHGFCRLLLVPVAYYLSAGHSDLLTHGRLSGTMYVLLATCNLRLASNSWQDEARLIPTEDLQNELVNISFPINALGN